MICNDVNDVIKNALPPRNTLGPQILFVKGNAFCPPTETQTRKNRDTTKARGGTMTYNDMIQAQCAWNLNSVNLCGIKNELATNTTLATTFQS